MKIKTIILSALASVLLGAEAFAGTYNWDATTNESLYNAAISFLKTFQSDAIGEPAYYMVQEALLEIEAAHKKDKLVWMGQIHSFCNMLEAIYPPQLEHPKVYSQDKYEVIRRDILKLRDYPIHEASSKDDNVSLESDQAQYFKAYTYQWLCSKREELMQALKSPRPTSDNEIQVFKVYSSGFIFRTKNACIGLDICYSEAFGDSNYVDDIAEYIDALFVTHAHGDHYDTGLLTKVYQKGKPIIMSDDIVSPSGSGKKFVWTSDHLDETQICNGVTALAKMGAQGTTPCLLYLIDIEGWRISAVGDNSQPALQSFYINRDMVDIVVAPVFVGLTSLFNSTYSAQNPDNIEQIYINAHENEFHHTVDGRVSYKYLFTANGALGNNSFNYPLTALMDNGEYIVIKK